tara:strand:- start:276 stop:542 length:267 start_codon:yes stop_codon:yes gene_type:complete
MPAGKSSARPKNRDQKKAMDAKKSIERLQTKLLTQLMNDEITPGAYKRAMQQVAPARTASIKKGIIEPVMNQANRKANKKTMATRTIK